MRKYTHVLFICAVNALPLSLLAQATTIHGNVRNSTTKESVPAAEKCLR